MEKPQRDLKMPIGLTVCMDNDVKLVLEFMLRNIDSSKCIKVAKAVNVLAPVLFERYIEANQAKGESFIPLALIPPDISE